tara:strand:- start:769 stop:1551 length:783 start_codon:yes stop_codon:yes gene_type:complete
MAILKFTGTSWTSIAKLDNIAPSSIAKVSNISVPSSGTSWQSTIYDFNSQTRQTGNNSDWSPSTAYTSDGWINGQSAINGSQWTSGTSAKGMNCDSGTTPSSQTGPAGGMTSITNGTPNSSGFQRYLYKESSGIQYTWDHICRTPGYNFSSLMNSTTNNLRMVFWYHAYGNTTWSGNLYTIYTDTSTTSTSTASTQLQTLAASGNLMSATTSPYLIQYVDLNNYRTVNSTHYFYMLLNPQTQGTGFRHDIALDTVYFEEY